MIEVKNLKKYFGGIRAVDDISFTIKNGERFILLGTSGCGKTTTLKMINRLIEPDSGEVLIDGKPNSEVPPQILRRRMGYVLQGTGLFPHFTIEENISVVPDLLKWDKSKTRERTVELLNKFSLAPEVYMPLYPGQLSGGQQQRVGFARALVSDPPILLMDEPLGALDPITRQQLRNEFKHLNELKEKTIILVTHDVSEAIELADRICVMDSGKIQQTGTALELLLHPVNEFVKQFFSHGWFVLRLSAFRLKNIISYFEEIMEYNGTPDVNVQISLMDLVERFSDNNTQSDGIVAVDEEEHRFYKVRLNTLLSAVQHELIID